MEDRYYTEKLIAQLFKTEAYTIDEELKKDLLEDSEKIEYEFCSVSTDSATNTIGVIYKNIVDFWDMEYYEWRPFQRTFIFKMNKENYNYLNNWRLQTQKQINQFGVNEVFVYCDEDQSYCILDWLNDFEKEVTFEKINKKFEGLIVNVPNYFISGNYKDAPEYMGGYIDHDFFKKFYYAEKHNINLYEPDSQYPVVFYDDFYDLDKSVDSENRLFEVAYDNFHVIEIEQKREEHYNNIQPEREVLKIENLDQLSKINRMFVRGYGYCHAYNFWCQFKINQEVFLIHEPENKHDKNAIAIYSDIFPDAEEKKPTYRRKIGYIPKEQNIKLLSILKSGRTIKAFIVQLNEEKVEYRSYNQAIEIEVYLEE